MNARNYTGWGRLFDDVERTLGDELTSIHFVDNIMRKSSLSLVSGVDRNYWKNCKLTGLIYPTDRPGDPAFAWSNWGEKPFWFSLTAEAAGDHLSEGQWFRLWRVYGFPVDYDGAVFIAPHNRRGMMDGYVATARDAMRPFASFSPVIGPAILRCRSEMVGAFKDLINELPKFRDPLLP